MNPQDEFTEPVEFTPRLSESDEPSGDTAFDNDPIDDRLDELASEFVDRYRKGERPPISEYANRYPDLAEDIRELFPTIAQMEGLKVQIEHSQKSPGQGGAVAGHVQMSRLGDFRIIREVGRGGMGVVYEAEQTSLGRRVAVKVLPLLSVSHPELVQRFQREARTAARLHHTNIVPVFGVGEADGFLYYVMQLIDGTGLDELIEDGCETAAGTPCTRQVTELDHATHEHGENDFSRSGTSKSEAERQSTGAASHEPAADEGDAADEAETPPADGPGVTPQGSSSANEAALLENLLNDHSTSLSVPTLQRIDSSTSVSATGASGGKVSSEDDGHSRAPGPERSSSTLSQLGFTDIVRIGIQAADALQYAHEQGTLHRDIKPGNLLLDRDGIVWVADFGLAKAMEGDDITRTENVVGTVRYMAPEQFRGVTDARSDIYSLGLTLYELIAQRRAWSATDRSLLISEVMGGDLVPLRKIRPGVPRDLETVILKATARDVGHRYQTAGELADDLRRIAADRPIHARRVGPVERLWRWSRRNPLIAGLSMATVLSLMLFTLAAAVGYTAERQQRQRAESTSRLALEALDRIFERFAPGDSAATSGSTLADDADTAVGQAVLSPEAAELLAGMLEFYERLASQSDDAPQLMLKCAQARQRVGDIYQRLGQYGSAIAAYRVAIAEYNDLAEAAGSEFVAEQLGEPTVIQAGLLNGIGSCQLMLAQQDESRQSHQKAMELLKGLAADVRKLPGVRYELARTHCLLAWRLDPGEAVGSQLTESDQERIAYPPGSGLGRPHPGGNHPPGGGPPPGRGRPPRGPHAFDLATEPAVDASRQQHFQRAIDLLEELSTEFPAVPRYRFLQALCLRENAARSPAGANSELNRACELLETLVDQYPDAAEYRLALAEAYARVDIRPGALSAADAELAEASIALAVEHARRLVEKHPTVPAFSSSLLHIHHRLATIQLRRAEAASSQERRQILSEAERNLRSALELQESLLRRSPDVASYHVWAASFRNSLARILRRQHRYEESRQMSEYALERFAEIPASAGDTAACHEMRGDLYQELAVTLGDLGEVEAAVDAMLSAQEQYDLVPDRGRRRSSHDAPGFNRRPERRSRSGGGAEAGSTES